MAKPTEQGVEKTNNGQSIIIAILATVVVFMAVFITLILTGILKFGDTSNTGSTSNADAANTNTDTTTNGTSSNTGSSSTPTLVDNPNPRVKVNGKLIEVGNLEFYLPSKFTAASDNGKNGKYDFNLTEDSGWATVTVYVETTNKKPMDLLLEKSQYLEQTDANYTMNGQTWVQAETGSMLAYATTYGDQVYAIIYSVKLDSDATSEAMSMIPKTLYFKKLYQ